MKKFFKQYRKHIISGGVLLYAVAAIILWRRGDFSLVGAAFALLPAIAAGIWLMRNYKFTRTRLKCEIDGVPMKIVDIYPLLFWKEPRQRAIRHRYGISSIIPLDGKPHGELYLKGISSLTRLYFDTQFPRQALILGVAGGAVPRYLLSEYPDCRATGIELSSETIEVMSPYFLDDLPRDRFTMVNADAADFVADAEAKQEKYDFILCDIFSGGDPVSAVYSEKFFRHIAAILSPGGFAAMNLQFINPHKLLEILQAAAKHLGYVELFSSGAKCFVIAGNAKDKERMLKLAKRFRFYQEMAWLLDFPVTQ